jgi:hypothetical protein
MISRRLSMKLICCLSTSNIIIWSRWKKRKCAILSSCENSSLISWRHSSRRSFCKRLYLNTWNWLNVSRSFQLASKFSSLSSNCLVLTKFRIECMRENVWWLKTCIYIEDKMTVDWLLTDCWLIIELINSKEIFKSKSLILFFAYENQKW